MPRHVRFAGCWLMLMATPLLAEPPPPIPAPPATDQPPAPVLRVEDDLSVVVEQAGKPLPVRLVGVRDAGDGATKRAMESLLLAETVYIVTEAPPESDVESDGPMRVYLYRAPDGLLINLELLRRGDARLAARPPFEHRDLFRHYETRARLAGKGAWSPDREIQPDAPRNVSHAEPAAPSDEASSDRTAGDDVIVYVTRTGTKYHRQGCRHLSESSQPKRLGEARRSHEPCKVCRPPE